MKLLQTNLMKGLFVNLVNEMDLPSLSEDQCKLLLEIPITAEIKHHMFDMKDNASPGPDGITSKIFKFHRNVVGQSTIQGIQSFFYNRTTA